MSNEKKLLLTVTGETFHPARIYYHVYDRKKLLSLLGTLKCMQFDNLHTRWVWLYEGEAKQLKFKNPYSSIPKAQRPIVLGSLYLRKEDEAFIDLRSFERAIKAILFFDRNIPRNTIKVKDIAVVNKCFEFPIKLQPNFDEFFEFGDVVSNDPEAMLDKISDMKGFAAIKEKFTNLMNIIENLAKEKLPEIERFPVNYYEDGIDSLETALCMREIVALEHWKGNNKFSIFDLVKNIK